MVFAFVVCGTTGWVGSAYGVPLWQMLPLGLVLGMAIGQGASER